MTNRGAPTSPPSPWTMLNTPGGKPISCMTVASKCAVSGVNSEGLHTTVLPHASAGATFHDSKYNGKFHGVTNTPTPTDERCV